MFSGSGITERQLRILSDVWVCRESKMVPLIGSINDITYVSASIHNNNKIPTAIPMFSGSGYKIRLMWRLLDMWICEESKDGAY